ncbi:MAG: Mov34/MPN/PAD-1 family protein [Candidatus Caldarchaeum sp.]|nr:Mov34/MPN/PAD-1 family protein [Candidatus Caldarchaeum sp.]MDW7977825.1 Mov34/MPN/PAD-1 family protein [Candidatus Caldarchaeum sp.]
MRVRIYPLALAKIVKHSTAYLNREVAGLLVGKSVGQVLEVWDAVTGEQYGTAAYVHLDEAVMTRVAEQLAEEGKGLYIVGWYHSHPGLTVFLSPTDIDTQKRYQSMYPKAVALVIDPVKYAQTRRISSLEFKVFQISKEGKVVALPVSIGVQRSKLLESTFHALGTFDVRQLNSESQGMTRSGPAAVEEDGFLGKAKKLFGMRNVYDG